MKIQNLGFFNVNSQAYSTKPSNQRKFANNSILQDTVSFGINLNPKAITALKKVGSAERIEKLKAQIIQTLNAPQNHYIDEYLKRLIQSDDNLKYVKETLLSIHEGKPFYQALVFIDKEKGRQRTYLFDLLDQLKKGSDKLYEKIFCDPQIAPILIEEAQLEFVKHLNNIKSDKIFRKILSQDVISSLLIKNEHDIFGIADKLLGTIEKRSKETYTDIMSLPGVVSAFAQKVSPARVINSLSEKNPELLIKLFPEIKPVILSNKTTEKAIINGTNVNTQAAITLAIEKMPTKADALQFVELLGEEILGKQFAPLKKAIDAIE